MRKNIEKTEIYCQSLPSENDNKLQLSRFFDNSAQNFSCHAPRYPRKTALEQKLFASVSEVENVLVCLGQDREGCGGEFCLYCGGFFLPAQGNRFAGKSPKYQPSLGLRQRRMEETPPPKPLYRTREQRIPAGQGEISCRNWKSWHGACWLLRHSTAERPTEALHRTARFYIGEEKGGPARGRAIDRPAKKSCRMAGHRGRGVQPIL